MGKALISSVEQYFNEKGFGYGKMREDVIRTGFGNKALDNLSNIEILIIFDDNDRTVSIRSYDLVRFPEDKKMMMYPLCSALNSKFRWVKFYVDESDNTITIEDDAILDIDSAGEELIELCGRMASIGDEAYPIIMKTLYA